MSIGNGFGEWRQTESQELSKKIQNEFHQLQNPQDCNTAKKIVCEIRDKDCGFVIKSSFLVLRIRPWFDATFWESLNLNLCQITGLDVRCTTSFFVFYRLMPPIAHSFWNQAYGNIIVKDLALILSHPAPHVPIIMVLYRIGMVCFNFLKEQFLFELSGMFS